MFDHAWTEIKKKNSFKFRCTLCGLHSRKEPSTEQFRSCPGAAFEHGLATGLYLLVTRTPIQGEKAMIETTEGGTVITGEHMELYRLIVLKSALELQKKIPGIKVSRGVTASALAKRNFGMKGNLDNLIRQTQERITAFRAAEEQEKA